MFKVIILPLAKEDILEISKWYNKKRNGLGLRFTKEVRKTVKYVQNNPNAVAIRYDNTRTAIVKKFPIMIHYSLDESSKTIVISSVFSTSINPIKWNER